MIGPLVSLLAFAVALGVLVFVHELGHFMVAKRLGILVERFSIGFGPVLFSRRWGETEYAVSAVPLGGYVKMLGEDDEEEARANPERAFSTQRVGRRAAIVFGGAEADVYRIGIEVSHDWQKVSPVRAVVMAGDQTYGTSVMVLKGLVLMMRGRVPLRELGGPIAIARAAGQQARAGLRYFLAT